MTPRRLFPDARVVLLGEQLCLKAFASEVTTMPLVLLASSL